MTTNDIDTDYVCHACIGNTLLAKQVLAEGTRAECRYCDRVSEALPLYELAERIHEVLQTHFELTPSEPEGIEYTFAKEGMWERSGSLVEWVIADIADIGEKIATDVRELLSDRYGYQAMKDGEEDPYSNDACYEQRSAEDATWKMFCDDIRSHGRFFNSYAEDELNRIFGDLGIQKMFHGKPVIREIRPGEENSQIWRARTALSAKELKVILKDPAREIGPPPPRLAKGGRMNAPGISVFYGAMDKNTCIAELRAPVGSQVVVVKFELTRPVRLLDLEALTEIWNIDASYFDPEYDEREDRVASLRSLGNEICRPVLPQDEDFEYLPSQAVAEFLANKVDPPLDGIIFPSSQTDGGGHNVVLFSRACGVVPDDLPKGTKVEVCLPPKYDEVGDEDEDYEDSIRVFEVEPSTSPGNDVGSSVDPLISPLDWVENDPLNEELPIWSEPTLRLDMEGVFVVDIKSVRYEYRRREVCRYRSVKEEA